MALTHALPSSLLPPPVPPPSTFLTRTHTNGGARPLTSTLTNFNFNFNFKAASTAAGTLPAQTLWNNTGRGYPDIAALGGQVVSV